VFKKNYLLIASNHLAKWRNFFTYLNKISYSISDADSSCSTCHSASEATFYAVVNCTGSEQMLLLRNLTNTTTVLKMEKNPTFVKNKITIRNCLTPVLFYELIIGLFNTSYRNETRNISQIQTMIRFVFG
jgi:hypothetical protein